MSSHPSEPWGELLYHLITKSRPIPELCSRDIVTFLKYKQFNIPYISYSETRQTHEFIESESVSAATEPQKESLKVAFEQALHLIRQQVRDNIINIEVSQTEYEQKYSERKEFIRNIQSMCKPPNDENNTFDDEQLLQLLMALTSPNDLLLIFDLIIRIECEAVNYGVYNVTDDANFIKACNEYIRYNMAHYEYDKKAFTEFIQALSVFRRSRFLNPMQYLQKIKKIDEDDCKESEQKYDSANVIQCKLGYVQRQICSSVFAFLKYVSRHSELKNCSIVCDILSFCKYRQQSGQNPKPTICKDTLLKPEIKSDKSDLETSVCDKKENPAMDLYEAFESVEFTKNMRAENMAYISMNENGDINIEYIGKSESEIGFSLSDTTYKQFYSDNHLFHVMRGNRKCINGIGLGMYKFGDRIKLYWHDCASVLPVTLKDPYYSKFLQFRFKSDSNALKENHFYNTVLPHLQQYRHLSSNHYLDHRLYIHNSAVMDRLAIHNSNYTELFKNIKLKLDNDRIQNKECTDLRTYRSEYGIRNKIKLTISDAQTMQLSLIISEPFFKKQSIVYDYLNRVIIAQINNNEMTLFTYDTQTEGIVALGVHDQYSGEELFGIVKKMHCHGSEWIFDDHRTKTEISKMYGFDKLPKAENIDFEYFYQSIFETGFAKHTPLPLTFVSMQINVMDLLTKECIHLTVHSHDTIHSIKQKIENRKGYPTDKLILLMLDRVLSNDNTLYDYNIQSNDNLFLMFRFGDSNQVQSPNRESDEKDNDSDSENDGKDEEKQINISNAENIDESTQQNIDEQKDSEDSDSGSFSLQSGTPPQVQSDWSSGDGNTVSFDKLPVRVLTEKEIEHLKIVKCAICQNDFEAGDELKRMTCFHEYHSACIDQWLVIQAVCPVCKTKIFG